MSYDQQPGHDWQQTGFGPESGPPRELPEEEIYRLERPVPQLLTYYLLSALTSVIFFPLVFPPLFFKYRTMRYRFDEEGVSMRWGLLFRREVNLTYARIQDIHLSSNFIERWLGLAKVQLQTASGSAMAEMTIEGLPQYEAIRNFLYEKVKGERRRQQGGAEPGAPPVPEGAAVLDAGTAEKLVAALEAVAARLEQLQDQQPGSTSPPAEDAPGPAPPPGPQEDPPAAWPEEERRSWPES